VNVRWLHEEIAKSMDLDVAQLLKTPEQKQQEAEAEAEAAQNSPEMQAFQMDMQVKGSEIEKNQSAVAKDQSETALDAEKLKIEAEKLKIERAKAVSDIQAKAMQAAKPQPAVSKQ